MLFLCQYLLNCNLLMGMFHRKRKLFIKRSCSSFFGDFFRVLLTLKQLQTIARICCVIMQKSEKAMATHSILLPGKSHGQRSLVGCSPWGREESDTTERLHFDFSLLCIGEENGNPLQYSCLENPRDGGAWWAAVYGVAQSQT